MTNKVPSRLYCCQFRYLLLQMAKDRFFVANFMIFETNIAGTITFSQTYQSQASDWTQLVQRKSAFFNICQSFLKKARRLNLLNQKSVFACCCLLSVMLGHPFGPNQTKWKLYTLASLPYSLRIYTMGLPQRERHRVTPSCYCLNNMI